MTYSFRDHHGVQRTSSTMHGICMQAATYFRCSGFRPGVHEVRWHADVEEWRSRLRNDLTDRAYTLAEMRRAA